jgi:hypothetical protein
MGSACELECELVLCVDLRMLEEAHQREVLQTLVGIKRMLSGLTRRLRLQESTPRDPGADS